MHGACLTPTFKRENVSAHFVHALKEWSLQRFFTGSVVLAGWADIPAIDPDDDDNAPGNGSIVFLKEVEGSRVDSLRHHICFIVPADAALDVINDDGCLALRQCPQET